jgi:ferritin-like metal-binding protein YciE
MPIRSPNELLATELKEIHSAERQLSRALPKLAKSASSERLRDLLDRRREQGSTLIEAVDEALEELRATRARKKNVVMESLIDDMNQHADEIEDERMVQAAVLGSVQKIEHYCIASWGLAASMGRVLEQEKVVGAMQHALEEGKQLDKEMTELAESEINPAMCADEEGEEGGEEEEGGGKGSQKRQGSGGRRKSAA